MISTFPGRLAGAILKISQLSTAVLILLTVIIQFLIMMAFALIAQKDVAEGIIFTNFTEQILLLIVVAPLVETLLFQYSIIDYITTTFKSQSLAILLSAIAFGLTHYYSQGYIVATFFSGILFAFMFLVFRAKNKSGILCIMAAHALYNLLILLLRVTAS